MRGFGRLVLGATLKRRIQHPLSGRNKTILPVDPDDPIGQVTRLCLFDGILLSYLGFGRRGDLKSNVPDYLRENF